MDELLLYFLLGPIYLILELGYLTGILDGNPDSVRMVVSALGTAFYAAIVGYGV